jgi:glycosyltransferase involved in cell wall biosynthesis
MITKKPKTKEKNKLIISNNYSLDIKKNPISENEINKKNKLLLDPLNIHFVFIICSYNNEENIKKNLLSVINQTYKNWNAIYINDASNDKTEELFFYYINKYNCYDKFKYIKNYENKGQMYNKYHAYKMVNDLDIVCILDGDDWLSHQHVLSKLYEYYSTTDNKIITSNFNLYKNSEIINGSINKKYNKNVVKNRSIRYESFWGFRHLKTGYGFLFKSIPKKYVTINNNWLKICTDMGEMYAISDLTSNILCTDDIFYIYNYDNSIKYPTSYYNNSSQYTNRKEIEYYLRTLEQNNYQLPEIYIINLKQDIHKRIDMLKQMNIIKHKNFNIIEAEDGFDYSNNEIIDMYKSCYYNNIDIIKSKNKINIYNKFIHLNDIYFKKYNVYKQHITNGSYGLLKSIFKILNNFIESDKNFITIFEDDIYTLKDFEYYNLINEENLKNIDLLYLGCHNNNNLIYNNINDKDIFIDVNNIEYLIYGTYGLIISKNLAQFILNITLEKVVEINMSWDILLNFIREYVRLFNFKMYFKQLVVPEVRKDGINGIRDNDFYLHRNVNLRNYNL